MPRASAEGAEYENQGASAKGAEYEGQGASAKGAEYESQGASAKGAEYEGQGQVPKARNMKARDKRRRRGILKPGASAEQREARRPWLRTRNGREALKERNNLR